jgi:pimeloyl-ACP methyl ester carboxylesterase
LLVAAWHPSRVAGLVLVGAAYDSPPSDSLLARALKDCPPDWAALRGAVECPVLVLPRVADVVGRLESFLGQLGPGVT